MVPISSLWLPILLSAVFVFIVSSLIHTVLGFHKNDYRKLSEEDRVMDALRLAGAAPGRAYHFPFIPMKERKSPEAIERFKRGPIGLLTLFPSKLPSMGKFLAQWFVYCLVIGVFVAYLTGRTRAPGAPYLEVFRVAGTIAFLGYAGSMVQESIWKGQTWGVTFKHVLDGLIYALLTAGTFGWLWPK